MCKSISHLTLIGGCILLLAGLMLSCTGQTVKPKKILMNDFTGAIQKVNTYGEDIGEGQKRLRVSDDTFKYCVIVDNKDSSFVVGRARLLGFSADGWSFSTKTQKLKFFMTQKGEMLDDGKYHLIGQEKALDTKTAQALTKKFEASQKELVNLINQTFGPPPGVSLAGLVTVSIPQVNHLWVFLLIQQTKQTSSSLVNSKQNCTLMSRILLYV